MSISKYFELASREAVRDDGACGHRPFGLDWVLRCAMVDRGAPTLRPGEGEEARRLLALVDWDRAGRGAWPRILADLRHIAAMREGYGYAAGKAAEIEALRLFLRWGVLADGPAKTRAA